MNCSFTNFLTNPYTKYLKPGTRLLRNSNKYLSSTDNWGPKNNT